jgi:hypothetical protein
MPNAFYVTNLPRLLCRSATGVCAAIAFAMILAVPARATSARLVAVSDVLLHYGHAMEARDWRSACAVMTDRAQKQVVANAKTYKHKQTRSCATAYALIFLAASGKEEQPITSEWMRAMRTTQIIVHGAAARAMGYTLVLTRGRWLISA